MSIDIKKLKALAEAATGFSDVSLAPDVLLELIADYERVTNNRDMWKGQCERQSEMLRLAHEADKLLKAECEGLRADAKRANYWKQRAKSAEGHLFAGDWRAAALELHRYSRFESTPWPELTGQQRALICSAAGSVIACVNAMRTARKPKDGADNGETIWCECGDGYPANSYGAGFMDANDGVCENCDAANLCASQSTSAKISDALGRHKGEIAAERDAVKREGLVEAQKACDRIAGDSAGRSDRERKGAGECSAAIRALIVAMSKESGQ